MTPDGTKTIPPEILSGTQRVRPLFPVSGIRFLSGSGFSGTVGDDSDGTTWIFVASDLFAGIAVRGFDDRDKAVLFVKTLFVDGDMEAFLLPGGIAVPAPPRGEKAKRVKKGKNKTEGMLSLPGIPAPAGEETENGRS